MHRVYLNSIQRVMHQCVSAKVANGFGIWHTLKRVLGCQQGRRYRAGRIKSMNDEIAQLQAEIAVLQAKIEQKQQLERDSQPFEVENGKIKFEKHVHREHKTHKVSPISYVINLPLLYSISSPFVYGMIIPIAFLDLCLVIYQAVCFRVWKIPPARRSDYIVIDRHHLAYLNLWEKLNCVFCGYANGIFPWAVEIAGRTEQFWCPIKHAKRINQPHQYYHDYVEFGDWENWKHHPSRKKLDK